MKTINIEIPEGYEVDSFDKQSGKLTFKEKPKKVTDRIKTVADILADNSITQAEFDKMCEGLEADEVAYRIVKLLARSLNEGWYPNWSDGNERKFIPYFYMGGSSGFRYHDCDAWASVSLVGSRLCFKSAELASYAGNQFTEVYKKFMLI
jgi:hypothetical protein